MLLQQRVLQKLSLVFPNWDLLAQSKNQMIRRIFSLQISVLLLSLLLVGLLMLRGFDLNLKGLPDLVGRNDGQQVPHQMGLKNTDDKASSPADGVDTYIVKSGDTLGHIALRFNLTVEALKDLNHLEKDFISVGDSLIVKKEL